MTQQPDLLIKGIEQGYSFFTAGYHFTGMGMKGNDHRFSVSCRSFRLQLSDDLLVAEVNTVESADGDHGFPENRELINISVNLHRGVQSYKKTLVHKFVWLMFPD
jgi:hypothetical protein